MASPSIQTDPTVPIPESLLPLTATVRADGHLEVGGCDVVALAEEFGTPLFIYDEEHLRSRCREAVAAFGDGVAYATGTHSADGTGVTSLSNRAVVAGRAHRRHKHTSNS